MNQIADQLAKTRAAIAVAAKEWGRQGEDVCLIAVSKTKNAPAIKAAIDAGQRDFGENRVQEALDKFPALKKHHPDIRLHLIGPLQSNKVKDAVGVADFIHSLDREKLARLLAEEIARQGRRPGVFIQVNIGEEPQKAGIAPGQTASFIQLCRDLSLPLMGLMCIPPVDDDPAPYFALLAKLAKDNQLSQLSMGMSSDFRSAIALGATHVRIGSAIFGERTP